MRVLLRTCIVGLMLTLLGGCGGHGGGGSSGASAPAPPAPTPQLSNFAPIVVDGGPAALAMGSNAYISDDLAFVSVTLCAPGTNTCQTIDHVQVDTGSSGLRIVSSVLNPALLAALPNSTDANRNPVGECVDFIDGYAFGSVRDADFKIGGESVSSMPLQVIADAGPFTTVPAECSSGGGTNLNTVKAVGANGIIGVGTQTTDCGAACASAGGSGSAIYYDCPAAGCGAVIGQAASTTAPFQQLPNPVAAMATDNNGVIVSLPAVAPGGQATVSGTIYFGIGTQTNNALGGATVLTATSSSSTAGPGFVTAQYNGASLPDSFIDSGSNLYVFTDDAIPLCTAMDFNGYYCPASPQQLNPTLTGLNGTTHAASFTLNNAQTLLSSTNSVLPGIGGNPKMLNSINTFPTSFDFGLPFFYGRNIFTAIDGRNAGGVVGPYFAY